MRKLANTALVAGLFLLQGCAGVQYDRTSCADHLDTAWHQLDLAKADGFAGTVSYSKAVALLTAAKALQTVEKFEQCVTKAKQAQYYIDESRQGRWESV